MTPVPELDPETGEVLLAEPTLTVLVNHATERQLPIPYGTDVQEQLRLLRHTQVIDQASHPHPLVARALSAIADPVVCTVELSYAGKATMGWAGDEYAALLLPADEDGRRKLAPLPRSLLPDALGRLVDLGERFHAQPAEPVRYQEGVFVDAFRHWRLTSVRTTGDGVAATRVLEVIDAPNGLWALRADADGGLVAWPSTPTRVLRALVDLVTRTDPQQAA